ncbi:hypothetical protein [Labilithrix luteola]|nr:hypothetical protein [Labilithrix luteola]
MKVAVVFEERGILGGQEDDAFGGRQPEELGYRAKEAKAQETLKHAHIA